MPHKIGMHWIKAHGRPVDLDFVRELQPPSVKLVAGDVPDVQWISDTFRAAPNTLLVLRSHAMSEQKDDMRNAPQVTGNRHAMEWRSHVDKLRAEANRRGVPFPEDQQLVILGINEPILHADGALPVTERVRQMRLRCAELNAYTVAMCDRGRQVGLTVGAMNLSVGWPTNWDFADDPHPGAAPDWSPFKEAGEAIQRGNHFLVLHEYWADRGPAENRTWWTQRYTKCPWPVKIIIGECGVDMYVKDGNVSKHARGWLGRFSPEEYVAQIRQYHEAVMVDARIHSIQIFSSDYNDPWQSFDLLPAYAPLLAYAKSGVGVAQPFARWIGFVTASAGLNLRQAPALSSSVARIIPFGDSVTVTGKDGNWYQVEHSGAIGYVSADYIGTSKPAVQPVTSPVQYPPDFMRAIDFVLQEEGGLADNTKDPGGLTKYGISQAAYPNLNIRDLTKDQAIAIYFADYWQKSGADKLPWPMSAVHLDSAVNVGVSRAAMLLNDSGGNIFRYLSNRLIFYTNLKNWQDFGAGWTRRVARLMAMAA